MLKLERQEENDSRNSMSKDTNNESIDYQESMELSDMIDSKVSIQSLVPTMQCLESNSTTGTCSKNLEHCEDDNYFVIDNGPLDPNSIQESLPQGRRIVDISHMWNEIQRTFNDHMKGIECQFRDWKLDHTIRKGLKTQFFFKCNATTNIWSEPEEPKTLDINMAAVAGTITVGIGYAQLEELCAAMNIPCMSEKPYIEKREKLVDNFEKTAMENGWRS